MSLLLLGQSIWYQRWLNILSGFFDFARAKMLLKENQANFQEEPDLLFGDTFREAITQSDQDTLYEGRAYLLQ